MEQLGVQNREESHRTRENLNLGGPLPKPVRPRVTNRKVTYVTADPASSNSSLVPARRSGVGFRSRNRCLILRVSSSGGGLFGRPVILWIRGASYLK